jgi:MFS family permease
MVGWIFSVYVFLSFFGGLQVGPLFDLNGPRMLIIAGSFCLVLGILLMGQSTRKQPVFKMLSQLLMLAKDTGTSCFPSVFSPGLARP